MPELSDEELKRGERLIDKIRHLEKQVEDMRAKVYFFNEAVNVAQRRQMELENRLMRLALLGIDEALISSGKAAEIVGVSYSDIFEANRRRG